MDILTWLFSGLRHRVSGRPFHDLRVGEMAAMRGGHLTDADALPLAGAKTEDIGARSEEDLAEGAGRERQLGSEVVSD